MVWTGRSALDGALHIGWKSDMRSQFSRARQIAEYNAEQSVYNTIYRDDEDSCDCGRASPLPCFNVEQLLLQTPPANQRLVITNQSKVQS